MSRKLSIDELIKKNNDILYESERDFLITNNEIDAGGYILWFDKVPDNESPEDLYDLYLTIGNPDPSEPETTDIKIKVIKGE